MKKGHIYTLVFMVVLTAVLVFVLALANEGFKPAIDGHTRLRERRAVLDAVGQASGLADSEVDAAFEKNIRKGDVKGHEAYVYEDNGEVKGYAIPVSGPGLWGSISGYLGVSAQMDEVLGLVFTAQSETPGLGGRIDESWYKEQFRGIRLSEGSPIAYGTQGDVQLDAVTGATQTSKAVLKLINNALDSVIFEKEAN